MALHEFHVDGKPSGIFYFLSGLPNVNALLLSLGSDFYIPNKNDG